MIAAILSAEDKRSLLYSPSASPERLSAAGNDFLGEGLFYDALQFFLRASDDRGIERVKDEAMALGDAFLLGEVAKVRPPLVSGSDWVSLGAKARALGKEAYAERAEAGGAPPKPAFLEAKDEETAEDLQPPPEPAGKTRKQKKKERKK